jgi:molybdenum cofactor cytidylyltransferase
MPQLAILILAAGASSRMGGRDKLMLDANGTPLLTRVIQRAKATGLPVFVTVPDRDHPRSNLVRDCGASLVVVGDWATGMAASIRTGVAALPEHTHGVMILPGDMPDLQSGDLSTLAEAFTRSQSAIIRATSAKSVPGHPVIFPADLFDALQSLQGDTGARPVISAHMDRLCNHALPGDRALCDLDTPDDWAAWNAAQKTGI